MTRHQGLSTIARCAYAVPGVKTAARIIARAAAQRLPLSVTNKWRLHNFFGEDTRPDGPIRCSMPVPGARPVKLVLELEDYLSRVWYYLGYSGYERGTTALLCSLLKKKTCVFDVGANIGFYTVLTARLLEGRGQVHAFEPWAEMFERLARNLNLNEFKNVRLCQAAISDESGRERLLLPTDSSWTTASLVQGFMGMSQSAYQEVETVRLDDYCTRNKVPRLDLLRIDAEGAELKVIQSMGARLEAWWPDLIFEVLPPYDVALNEFFASKPYRKFLITDEGLKEVNSIAAHERHRDFYLSCNPVEEYPRA